MNKKVSQKILSVVVSILCSASSQVLLGYQTPLPNSAPDLGNPADPAPQGAKALQALVAPIALYPDSLVAQILTAATFPDQVAVADYWVKQNKSLTGNALMQAVDKQSWDPSVKALTEFSSVLDNMSKNLTWTSSLGEAYHDQQSEVMTAIQTLRAQAKAKGNLQSSPQIKVVQQSPQVIVIQPANPQIVYVPQYNPTIIYGTPYVVPGYVAPVYTTGDVVAAGIIGFGAGIAVGAMMSGGCCGWGTAVGTAAGTVLRLCITAAATTEIPPGTEAITTADIITATVTTTPTITTIITTRITTAVTKITATLTTETSAEIPST